jgi:hypothetical protein
MNCYLGPLRYCNLFNNGSMADARVYGLQTTVVANPKAPRRQYT